MCTPVSWWFLLGQCYVATLFLQLEFYGGVKLYRGSSISNGLHVDDSTYSGSLQSSFTSASAVTCGDVGGVGSFDTTCLLNSNLFLSSDVYIYGNGNIEILSQISVTCPVEGCTIVFNMSGNVKISQHATIVAGSIVVSAESMHLENNASINTTSFGGPPPPQTSGTPVGLDGAGGGHGGRGASCVKTEKSNWGGDVYSWSPLSEPWSYGSKGSGTSAEKKFGGNGGGRVKLMVKDMLFLDGSVLAEGGDGGSNAGGGSGGSIIIQASKL